MNVTGSSSSPPAGVGSETARPEGVEDGEGRVAGSPPVSADAIPAECGPQTAFNFFRFSSVELPTGAGPVGQGSGPGRQGYFMKTCLNHLTAVAIAVAGSLCLGAFSVRADLEISAGVQIHAREDFYQPLTDNGAWVDVGAYGHCWHPARVYAGWRPYCDGSWVWTDAGWYWQSDEPWAWACYHYGSWVFDGQYGWVWVPDIEWAPAWVNWRMGGAYIGWAPCGPRGVEVSPAFYMFVGTDHFHERHRHDTVIVNNVTIINKTSRVADRDRESREVNGHRQTVVVNRGPDVKVVEKAGGRKITTVSIREADRRTVVPATVRHHNAAPAAVTRPADRNNVPVVPGQPHRVPEHQMPEPSSPEHQLPVHSAPPTSHELPNRTIHPDQALPPARSEIPVPQPPRGGEFPLPNQRPESPVPRPAHELTPPNQRPESPVPQVPRHDVPLPNQHPGQPPAKAPHPVAPNHDKDQGHNPP